MLYELSSCKIVGRRTNRERGRGRIREIECSPSQGSNEGSRRSVGPSRTSSTPNRAAKVTGVLGIAPHISSPLWNHSSPWLGISTVNHGEQNLPSSSPYFPILVVLVSLEFWGITASIGRCRRWHRCASARRRHQSFG
jgi:hypothetical protein